MVGRTRRNVEGVSKKKGTKNIGCIIVHHGGSQKPDPRNNPANESRGPRHRRKIARRTLSVEAFGGRSHLTVRKWECEKHGSWSMAVEGFWNHVTTGGLLLGVSGRWSACGRSVVQLDNDEEMGANAWDLRHTGCS